MNAPRTSVRQVRPYEIFMLALSIYVLLALGAEAALPLEPGTRLILLYVDNAICFVFIADFVYNLVRAENRLGFLKWGWIDLLSSIPTLEVLRVGRLARIARILRLLHGVRSLRILSSFLLQRRAEATFWSAALLSILLVVFSSIAILEFEPGFEGANIEGPADALWWAYVTITTVGYGDRFPVTAEGRLIAAFLMMGGVGLFGAFTGYVASWFLAPGEKEEQAELLEIRTELASLRQLLEAKAGSLPEAPSAPVLLPEATPLEGGAVPSKKEPERG